MSFKKHSWLDYSKSGDNVEIAMTDYSGAKIEKWKVNNQKDYQKVLSIIKDKYGFDYYPLAEPKFSSENQENQEPKKEDPEDKDFLGSDLKW